MYVCHAESAALEVDAIESDVIRVELKERSSYVKGLVPCSEVMARAERRKAGLPCMREPRVGVVMEAACW